MSTLWGIPEWMCWYVNYQQPCEGPEAIDICLDLHAQAGVRHIAWNLGRSVVDYHSDLRDTTRMCERGDQVGRVSWAFVREVMDQVCPLRRALENSASNGLELWGRLSMNRHYGPGGYEGVTSHFASDHPQWRELARNGEPVPSRLCYAIDEVQQERIDILLEAHRIGVHGVVLDFCRQMPMLQYHPALVNPFVAAGGSDPRRIDSADPSDFAAWFQHRADVLTGFMYRLRQALRAQEQHLGRSCPVIARVPDNVRWLMLAYGLDTERWCTDDLVDGLMLSPFPITREDLKLHTGDHVRIAHDSGKLCIGGIGSKGLLVNGEPANTGFYAAQPVHALARRQIDAGVDGLSLYQSETLLRMEYLDDLWPHLGEGETEGASDGVEPGIGMDWHAHMRGRYGLQGDGAGVL
jgi:hypothetical protein